MSDEEKGYEPPGWLLTYGDMVTLLVTFFCYVDQPFHN